MLVMKLASLPATLAFLEWPPAPVALLLLRECSRCAAALCERALAALPRSGALKPIDVLARRSVGEGGLERESAFASLVKPDERVLAWP